MKSLFILAIALFVFPLSASEDLKPSKRPLSLTLSGGVSLAAYESGFLYYLSHHMHDSTRTDLKIVTGTSAGSINSVIAVINACQVTSPSPQQSVNWQTWMPLGIQDIVDPKAVTAISIFSREGVEKYSAIVEKAFMGGLRSDCEVVVGMAVTRKVPLKVEIKPGLTTDRHHEFFLLKIKGRGPGVAPLLENFPLKEAGQRQLFLPFGSDPLKNYKLLESVFYASAQFPLAFPPFPLSYCDLDSTVGKNACNDSNVITSEFIDGGIFNNTPISLSTAIADRFFTKKEQKDLLYAVITLDGRTHPTPSENGKEPSILNYMADLAGQFTETSRNRSVSEIYMNKNGILNQTVSNDKVLPRSSQYFVAFSGFLDRGFREYDFYLGMYEARHFLERYAATSTVPGSKELIHKKINDEYKDTSNVEWLPYFCFLETYEEDARAKGSCDKIKSKNFHILMQVNADIVKNRCEDLPKEVKKFRSCKLVKHLPRHEDFEDDESDQRFFYRRLEEMEYSYELAGGKPASGENIFRRQMEPLFKELVKKQPKNQRFLMREGADIFLNSLDFKPQQQFWRVGFGTHLQGTYGRMLHGFNKGPWIFANAGLMVRGLDTYLNSNPDAVALGPFAGLSIDFTPKTSFWLQFELGARGGYNYAIHEKIDICKAQDSFQSGLHCNSAFAQPHISVSILGRLRVELGSVIYFDEHHKNDFTMIAEMQF